MIIELIGMLVLSVILAHQYGQSRRSWTPGEYNKAVAEEEARMEARARVRRWEDKQREETWRKADEKIRKERLFEKILEKIPEKDLEGMLKSLDK